MAEKTQTKLLRNEQLGILLHSAIRYRHAPGSKLANYVRHITLNQLNNYLTMAKKNCRDLRITKNGTEYKPVRITNLSVARPNTHENALKKKQGSTPNRLTTIS
ncbi:MAG: hypothetical protein VX313_04380 [Bacteroidota bacterium]|nr:hypothetical protein [Bacteroidota bacterium]